MKQTWTLLQKTKQVLDYDSGFCFQFTMKSFLKFKYFFQEIGHKVSCFRRNQNENIRFEGEESKVHIEISLMSTVFYQNKS